VRIIASAFWFDGGFPEAADGRAQAFDRLIPNLEGSGQSMSQDLAATNQGIRSSTPNEQNLVSEHTPDYQRPPVIWTAREVLLVAGRWDRRRGRSAEMVGIKLKRDAALLRLA
jgi:hypothetical protein